MPNVGICRQAAVAIGHCQEAIMQVFSRCSFVGFFAAISLLAQVGCGQSSKTPEEYLAEAKAYMADGEMQGAIIQLSNALKIDPAVLEARWLLAQAALELGDAPRAEKEIRIALRLGLSEESGLPLLVRVLLLQGKYERVLAESSRAVSGLASADQVRLKSYRAEAFLRMQRITEAEQELEEAAKLSAEAAEYYIASALLQSVRGKYKEAIQSLEQAVEIDEKNSDAWSLLGQIKLQRREFEGAEDALTKAVEYRKGATIDGARRAHARIYLGKFAEAEADLSESYKQGLQDDAYVNYVYGLNYFKQTKYSEALDYFQQSARDGQPSLAREGFLATIHLILGNREQALHHADRVNAMAPQSARAQRLLGAAQISYGDYDDAKEVLKAALEENPDDLLNLELLAGVSMQAGDMEDAIDYYERLSELRPDSREIREALMLARLIGGFPLEQNAASDLVDSDRYTRGLLSAMASFRDGRAEEALTQARLLSANHPDQVDPINLAAAVYLSQGKWANAREELNRVLAMQPDNALAAVNLAKLELGLGNTQIAETLLRDVVQRHPEQQEAALLLARVESRQEGGSAGIEVLEQALDKNPDALQLRARLAAAYLGVGEASKALALTLGLEEEQYIKQPDLLSAQGRAYLKLGDPGAARRSFERRVGIPPESAEAHFYLAESLAAQGLMGQAAKELERSLVLNRRFLPARIGEIKLLYRERKAKEATDKVEELKREFGSRFEVLSVTGWVYLGTGKFDQAAAAFEEAAKQRQDTELTVLWVRSLWALNKRDDAIGVMQRWLNEKPKDVTVMMHLGDALLAVERPQEAREVYGRVVGLQPEHVVALNNLAWLSREADMTTALAYAKRAFEAGPEDPVVLDTYGSLLLDSGDQTRGFALIEKAAQLAPDRPEIQLHYGEALARQGQPDAAREVLNALLAISDADVAREARKTLQSLKGP